MRDSDFLFIAALLKERSGLALTQEKIYLLESRLSPVARRNGFANIDELLAALKAPRSESLTAQVVDAMTTNETSFFRDRSPFEALKKSVLHPLLKRRETQRSLRLWSAACSSGQEAYSLAIMLHDEFPQLADWRIEIVGTDISPTIVERAKAGVYSTFEVQRGLPIQLLLRHFEQTGDTWRIKDEIRRRIRFQQANLLSGLDWLGTFDIVFCRNVLIYFDHPTKGRVLNAIANRLAPDGALFLGGSESVFGVTNRFTEIAPLRGVYGHATASQEHPASLKTKVA